jgi:hypothetical protein
MITKTYVSYLKLYFIVPNQCNVSTNAGRKEKKDLIPDGPVLSSKIAEFSRRFADHLQDGVIQAILSTGRDHLIHRGQHVCVLLGQAVSHHASRELFRLQLDVRDGAAEGVGDGFGNLDKKKSGHKQEETQFLPSDVGIRADSHHRTIITPVPE